jgi:hypothetical protein
MRPRWAAATGLTLDPATEGRDYLMVSDVDTWKRRNLE